MSTRNKNGGILNGRKKQENVLEEYVITEYDSITQLINEDCFEEALHKIGHLAYIFYQYNQMYRDDFLEMALKKIEMAMDRRGHFVKGNSEVLFYDGFGLDIRGLAQIYIEALGALGYSIRYITREGARTRQPILKQILKKYNAEIIYLPDGGLLERYYAFVDCLRDLPVIGFLYTTPWDVVGILVFMRLRGLVKRYLINLTDHAFWLGCNAMDYCLEFRDYGASISHKFRKIPSNRLIVQPYYPIQNKNVPFEGFPFAKKDNDFVLFSGGSLYKTFDELGTYYSLVEYCLNCDENVKFWYAGEGDESKIVMLKRKYPERVFYTKERRDIYQIFQHIDMYLDTYPIGGGLMVQYSAMSGHAPLTLCDDDSSNGMLINNDAYIFNTIEKFQYNLKRYIKDENYRNNLNETMKDTVITQEVFRQNLNQIMQSNQSIYPCHIYDIQMDIQRKKFSDYFWGNVYSKLF